MTTRLEGVVLKRIPYGDTSTIVHVFTREEGIVHLLARGARSSAQRFGSTLEPLSHIDLLARLPHDRDGLGSIHESSHRERYADVKANAAPLGAALQVVEFLLALEIKSDASRPLFHLLLSTLRVLNQPGAREDIAVPTFFVRCATLLGYPPKCTRDELLRIQADRAFFAPSNGTFSPDPIPSGLQTERSAARLFFRFVREPFAQLAFRDDPEGTVAEASYLVEVYLATHLERPVPRRVKTVLSQLKGPF
jgi:DNA repair protein RecO (recombination protein O)